MAKLFYVSVPPQINIPMVASLPHSGTHIPRSVRNQYKQEFGPILTPLDWHLERLYDFLPELGIITIQATHSRYVVNLNRGPDTPLFGHERFSVVPDATCFGRLLYDNEPEQSEVEERVNKYFVPYHRRLNRILGKMVKDFGWAYLLDLHSYYRGPEVDVCLGNANETTCSEDLIGGFERALNRHDFRVTRNDVWVGGYITRNYGNMDNIEALQIELRFPAYLEGGNFEEDEIPGWDSVKFRNAKKRLHEAFSDVMDELF
jgi:N-formylglutamate deformylase